MHSQLLTTRHYQRFPQVPVWTLASHGEAPAAGPDNHPTYIPPTPPPSASAQPHSSRHHLSAGAQAGVAIGSIGAVMLVIGFVAMLRPVVMVSNAVGFG